MSDQSIQFHIRARALIISEGHVLLAHRKGAENTYLPGGHVDPGESGATTVVREIREELGITGEVTSFLGVVEHAYEINGALHQELNLIFSFSSPELHWNHIPKSMESHLDFLWVKVERLETVNLQPWSFRDLIRKYSEGSRETWWAGLGKPLMKS